MWLTNLFGKVKNISSDLSTELTKSLRLRLCSKCPQKRNYFRYLFVFKKRGVAQCKICKCALADKVIWQDEKCPLGKW